MATKTIDYLEKMVTLAHYEHEGFEYDTLHLSVMYRKGRGFFVSYQPVKRNGFGGFETGPLPSDDPLVGGKTLLAENADKNNAKRLQQMMANLEAGTEAVVWLFDHREWDKLNIAIVRLARDGYTESYQKQMHDLMAETGGSEKKDESPMMKQFKELKEKHPDAMLLFRCGDFYETYGDDAKEAAKILGITLTWRTPQKRHAPGDYTDAMAGFPHHALNTYLPKLVRAGKRVAICDQLEDPKLAKKLVKSASKREQSGACSDYAEHEQTRPEGKRGITELVSPATKNDDHELNESNESNNQTSEDKEMKNNNQNETKNVQDAQVSNVTTEADVAEVDDIVPVVTRRKDNNREPITNNREPKEKPAVTMPLGQHGTLIIASGGGDESRRKSGNNGKAAPTTTEEPKITLNRKTPQTSDISHQTSTLPTVTLVVYTTRHGDQAPRIEGFGGEDDPRWKRHYDEKQRLKAEKEKADKHNDKLRKAMKGKSKEHKALVMKKWITVPNDPFNAGYFTDRTTGDKTYTMVMGSKYMDVARELVNAYNSGDADAIAQAEQAVIDRRASINADYEAQREERKAAKMEDGRRKMEEPATAQAGYSDQDVADMLRKVMAGGDVPENIKKLLQAA